eukprot:COSAG06_NODE_131_length_22532_cov_12.428387_7_plen_91_part_00
MPNVALSVGQWGDQGRGGHGQAGEGCAAGSVENQLSVRSESQYQIHGYSSLEVFVPAHQVTITNVQTSSTRAYVAGSIALGQPFYTDRCV